MNIISEHCDLKLLLGRLRFDGMESSQNAVEDDWDDRSTDSAATTAAWWEELLVPGIGCAGAGLGPSSAGTCGSSMEKNNNTLVSIEIHALKLKFKEKLPASWCCAGPSEQTSSSSELDSADILEQAEFSYTLMSQ